MAEPSSLKLCTGALFAGIGGIELGLERTEHYKTIWFVEADPYCQKVLKKHWPGVPVYGDIRRVDFSKVAKVDVLTGGFPCQPHSLAGKRLGSADPRDLWSEFVRAIESIRPRYTLIENVPGLLYSADPIYGRNYRGGYFERILSDLASLGYDAEWQIIPASAFGAPHRRERLFIVAYAHRTGYERPEFIFYARKENLGTGQSPNPISTPGRTWAPEPSVGRVAYGVPNRIHRVRVLGNAVVPQIAEYIGSLIVAREHKLLNRLEVTE